jgi:hypothetical protein
MDCLTFSVYCVCVSCSSFLFLYNISIPCSWVKKIHATVGFIGNFCNGTIPHGIRLIINLFTESNPIHTRSHPIHRSLHRSNALEWNDTYDMSPFICSLALWVGRVSFFLFDSIKIFSFGKCFLAAVFSFLNISFLLFQLAICEHDEKK